MKKPVLAVLMSAMTAGEAAASNSVVGYGQYMSVVTRNLRESHATFDGQRVLDAKPHGRCVAVIVTPKGSTLVRWKDMGNLAPHLQGKLTLYDIHSPDRVHTFAAPTKPEEMNPAETVLRFLDDECSDPSQSDWKGAQ